MPMGVAGELTVVCLSLVDELALLLTPLDEYGLSFSKGPGVIGHPVRQKVLTLLIDNESLTRTELAEKAAKDPDIRYENPKRLEATLHHNHLPKLDDHLYIEYDTRNGDVVLWEDSETVTSLLNSK